MYKKIYKSRYLNNEYKTYYIYKEIEEYFQKVRKLIK